MLKEIWAMFFQTKGSMKDVFLVYILLGCFYNFLLNPYYKQLNVHFAKLLFVRGKFDYFLYLDKMYK